MAWYRAGSVNVTNGSNAVTGVNTAFIANARVGDAFVGPDGLTYEITNIASNTALSIFPPYRSATATNQAYAIQPVQGYTKTLADRASQLIDNFDKPWNSAEDAADARQELGLDKPWNIAADVAAARTQLGLGSAALRNVGTAAGDVADGFYPVRKLSYESISDWNTDLRDSSSMCSVAGGSNAPTASPWNWVINIRHRGAQENYGFQIGCGMITNRTDLSFRHDYIGTFNSWTSFLHSVNTTVDSNGFIKAASPVIKLFADKISSNEQASQQKPKFIKNDVGDYTITGTSGLAKKGWWIETPKDSNGNTKVIIQELEEVEQPDGTVTINIKTTEPRYGLDETGRLIGIGDPCDIPAGRWIDIRLQELPVDDEQPAEEPHSAE